MIANGISRYLQRLGFKITPRQVAMFIYFELEGKDIRVEKTGQEEAGRTYISSYNPLTFQ
jgi:hypothetical protein